MTDILPPPHIVLDTAVRRARHFVQLALQARGLRDGIKVSHDGERVVMMNTGGYPGAPYRLDLARLDPNIYIFDRDEELVDVTLNVLHTLYRGTPREDLF